MKTMMALLIANDLRPTMTHVQLAKLRNKSPRTILNEISAKRCPVPVWKDGGDWLCNVADVAAWMDRERDAAILAQPGLKDDYQLAGADA